MLGEPRIPEGIAKRDEFFGDVEVYYGSIAIQSQWLVPCPTARSFTWIIRVVRMLAVLSA